MYHSTDAPTTKSGRTHDLMAVRAELDQQRRFFASLHPVMERAIELAGREFVLYWCMVHHRVDALDVVVGRSWDDALEGVPWTPEDVLVVGSSSTIPLAQVFLGSSATKIVRASPVPVIVMP